ncbi:MAG: MBL fold metallo-hydrolase [Bacilli bacterium]|nr:MBL fold metallo-hydrolase [Bacilli bacterium]
MKVSVLASGSKGNSTYIESLDSCFLIDLGVSTHYIEQKLYELDVTARSIAAIIITHTHIDHVSGLKVFYKKYHPKVYLTKEMYDVLSKTMTLDDYYIINEEFMIGNIKITPFKASHDVEVNGYIIEEGIKKILYLTDTGYINRKYYSLLSNLDMYIIESNHDIEMLMNGNRPYHIKQRILGDNGHLSNKQTSEYLNKFCGDKTKCIILAHLSHDNNDPVLAVQTIKEALKEKNITVSIAEQNEKMELLEI